jgi:hypothetical protein
MLWGLLIIIAAGLLFVIFHKPTVNTAGAHWVPPQQRMPQQNAAPSTQIADGSGAVTQQAPAQMPDTFDFNDMFKTPKAPVDQNQPKS